MRFQVGKYYRHSGGGMMHILVATKTKVYGMTMIAEFNDGSFRPIGDDETSALNWSEVDDVNEWDNLFT